MRTFIILLFITFISLQLQAENIDERKTDIYFANGVGATSKIASFEQEELEKVSIGKATKAVTRKYES